ncbi:MAG: tetratricopeptide repeat protein [Firmicutes bacterium]|nr:tetratricopeptide repeat protein [Bacillota bacterium]
MKKLVALVLTLALLCGFAACGAKPKTAADWLDLGEKYLLDLDYDQAIAALDHAIEIEPKDPRPHVIKIIVYVMNPNRPGTPPDVPNDVPDMPDIFPLPVLFDPVEILRPLIDWLKDHGLLDFVQKLLELLKQRWPEVAWNEENVPVAATTLSNTATTTAEAIGVNTTTTNITTKPASASKSGVTEEDIRKAIQEYNNTKTLEGRAKWFPASAYEMLFEGVDPEELILFPL